MQNYGQQSTLSFTITAPYHLPITTYNGSTTCPATLLTKEVEQFYTCNGNFH